MKTIPTIAALLLAFTKNYTPRNHPKNDPQPQNNDQSNHWGWGQGGANGNVSIGFGTYPNYYAYNNYNSYNGYSIKKASRYSIRAAGQLINQAVAFDSWNDIYSPLLAKAIRHYNYSRQLYWWGNYPAAHNHAERARYLAWYSLQYFQDPNCGGNYGGGYQPDPYSDPYNPYYKTDQTGGKNQNYGNRTQEISKNENLDTKLPGSEINDRELIRSFDKTELKDE
jgi:hypothetical protein